MQLTFVALKSYMKFACVEIRFAENAGSGEKVMCSAHESVSEDLLPVGLSHFSSPEVTLVKRTFLLFSGFSQIRTCSRDLGLVCSHHPSTACGT